MGIVKQLSRGEAVRGLVCGLVAQYIRLVYHTSRWQVAGGEVPARLWDENKPFILAFWHGRLLMMPYCWRRGVPMNMLISQHRDGEFIARTIGHFGLGTVRGSPKKGGAQALRVMVRQNKAGEYVGITPDGPRGPRMRASTGIVTVARLAGVPVVPVSTATSRRRVLGSWDRFLVALPWSRGAFVWGAPVRIARDADEAALEAARREIEDQLNAISAEADRLCGHEPIGPEPLATEETLSPPSAPDHGALAGKPLQPQRASNP